MSCRLTPFALTPFAFHIGVITRLKGAGERISDNNVLFKQRVEWENGYEVLSRPVGGGPTWNSVITISQAAGNGTGEIVIVPSGSLATFGTGIF